MYGVPWSLVMVPLWMQNIKCALLLRIIKWDAVLSAAMQFVYMRSCGLESVWDIQLYQSLGRRHRWLVAYPQAGHLKGHSSL